MPCLLGIDLGEKRAGVSVSDETITIATPLKTIFVQGRRQLLREIQQVVQEYGVTKIVVGFPITLRGEIKEAAQKVQEHVEWFRSHSSLEWVLWDERLTTQEAERILLEADLSRARRKEVIDQIAAQRMLQSYIDFNRAQKDFHHDA